MQAVLDCKKNRNVIFLFVEEKGLRKHLLAYHRELRKPGLKAITDICIINPSKGEQVPPFFTTVG